MVPPPPHYLIGVVIDGVGTYGRSLLRGVMRHANGQRWVLHKDLWRTPKTLAAFPACDGAILTGLAGPAIAKIRSRCRHIVVCAGGGDPAVSPVVSLDDLAVGAMAAEHLIDCRVQHFAFYGNASGMSAAHNRLLGFRQTLAGVGRTVEVSPVPWPSGEQWFTHAHRPALARWLAGLPKPVGIFAVDDSAAHDLADACREVGLRVPDVVAILGVNNDDLLCEGAFPPLSSIEADFSRVGQRAAEMLDDLLAGRSLTGAARVVRLPPMRVVQRVSTSLLAVAEPALAEAVQFIRDHACDPCTVADVARQVTVGRRWLERAFLAEFDRTPHDEIIRVRIQRAKELLQLRHLSVADVAAKCGFYGPQNLARAFRQQTGSTPAAFRRQILNTA
jgi:LacI family transcriptional regulator